MTDNTYNGWTNYETWKHNLEMVNHDFWAEVFNAEAIEASGMDTDSAIESLASALEDEALDYADELEGYAASIMHSHISKINFFEIAKNILEG